MATETGNWPGGGVTASQIPMPPVKQSPSAAVTAQAAAFDFHRLQFPIPFLSAEFRDRTTGRRSTACRRTSLIRLNNRPIRLVNKSNTTGRVGVLRKFRRIGARSAVEFPH